MANTKIPVELSSTPGIVDNSNATAITIDSSENVGIGTSSPSAPLTVSKSTGYTEVTVASGSQEIDLFTNNINSVCGLLTASNIPIVFYNNSTERMRIDASGNVGIGTSSPSDKFHVKGTGSTGIVTERSGTSAAALIADSAGTALYSQQSYGSVTSVPFRIYTGTSERMRIDSSGNLLVGKTSSSSNNVGFETGSSGSTAITRDGGQPLILNRKTSDGDLILFRKDGTSYGIIGIATGGIWIGAGQGNYANVRFTNDQVHPCSSSGGANDGNIDLGKSTSRWDDVYATNGTIQTSDRNEKQNIEALTDAETRVAVAAKGLLRKFRWINRVEEKGDEARIHFGIIAQDLQDAFTAEGLDAGDYAMFISSTWTDDDGVEQTRLGVRYSELLAFIIAAI